MTTVYHRCRLPVKPVKGAAAAAKIELQCLVYLLKSRFADAANVRCKARALFMTDIFVSYANEDRERAAQLAELLQAQGWRVWWDRRIPAGRTWRSVLEDALEQSRCMLVLWSEHSVASPWVAEEAEEARRLGKPLVPVLLDRVEPPIGFRSIQCADLAQWDGSMDAPASRQLADDLAALLGGQQSARPEPVRREVRQQNWSQGLRQHFARHWPKAALAGLALALFVVWQNWPDADQPAPPLPEAQRADRFPNAPLTDLAVSGERKAIKPAEKLQLSLKGHYADGSQRELLEGAQWFSRDERVAAVDAGGQITGLRPGKTTVVAKLGDIESAEWPVRVEENVAAARAAPPRLVDLTISAAKQELSPSETVTLRVRGRYSDDSEKAMPSGIEWRVSNPSVVTVDRGGELIAERPGRTDIVARAQGLSSRPLAVYVKQVRKSIEPAKTAANRERSTEKKSPAKEETKALVLAHIGRAQNLREQGNYAGALTELEKARAIDAGDESVRKEIEQTKRACNAEKMLGNNVSC